MKKILAAVILLAAMFPIKAFSQDFSVAGRAGADIDWKIAKGLHLDAGYEFRAQDSFEGVERHQLSAGISYKVNDYLKLGAGYLFIGHYNDDSEMMPRHRFYFDATGSYDFGNWELSLKEKLQMTNKAYDINRFQDVRNELELKSRLKLEYQGIKHWKPYGFVEFRNVFNGPGCTYEISTTGKYTDYSFTGYNDLYFNRYRFSAGTEYKFNKHNSLDIYLLLDNYRSKDIDTNKEGTKLKSLTWNKGWRLSPGITYKFSF